MVRKVGRRGESGGGRGDPGKGEGRSRERPPSNFHAHGLLNLDAHKVYRDFHAHKVYRD